MPVTVTATPIEVIRQAAIYYDSIGLFPIELVGPCVPKDQWHPSPGKQPARKGWAAETEGPHPDTYTPGANLGLRMGRQQDGQVIVAIDIDTPDFTELQKIAPNWPNTLVARTGKGGYHALYCWPRGVEVPKTVKRLAGTQIDIRAEGGQIVVYPSVHPDTGVQYQWLNWGHEAVDLPEETARAILSAQSHHRPRSGTANPTPVNRTGHPVANSSSEDSGPTTGSDDRYEVSSTRWKQVCRKLASKDSAVAAAFEKLGKNAAFAEPGERDSKITAMCWALARELPEADSASIQHHFEPALSLMHSISPFRSPCDVAAKFESARNKQAQETPSVDLMMGGTGSPIPSVENVLRVLRQDNLLYGRFAYDEFAERIMVMSRTPWDPPKVRCPRQLNNEDFTLLTAYLMKYHRLNIKTQMALESIAAVSRENGFHPVREYLLDVARKWDGKARLDTWLCDYLGVEDTPVNRNVGRWWLMQGVVRVADPGSKADYCLVFEGEQGRKKSMALETLAGPEWFTDNLPDITNQVAAAQVMSGKWIVEIAELSAIRSVSDVQRVKAFITRKSDRYRVPYGKVAQDFPRQSIFAGTTNETEYLADPTGNRRFWPVAVDDSRDVDIEGLREARDQLWAEAAIRLARGEKYWPESQEEKDELEAEVQKRRQTDSWEDQITAWAENPVGYHGQVLTSAFLIEQVLGIRCARRGDDARFSCCLRALQWKKKGSRWIPPEALKQSQNVFQLKSVA